MKNLRPAVRYFSRISGAGYKFVATEFDRQLEELSKIETGLNHHEITVLLRVLTEASLSATRFKKLLHCVLPETTMQDEHVRTVIVWLLRKHVYVPIAQNVAVLQWLIVLLENGIADRDAIDSFYHQIYYLIFKEALARWSCKIIYLLTKPDDITRERVKRLLMSHRKQPRVRPFAALLGLFKSFRPELVPERITTVNPYTAFGKIPDKLSEAVNRLTNTHGAGVAGQREEINLRTDAQLSSLDGDSLLSETDTETDTPVPKAKKRKKINYIIPPPRYISAGSKQYSNSGELTVDYFRSVVNLAYFQLSVDTPNFSLSLLQSNQGRHMITFDKSTLLVCFSFQLHNVFDEVFLKCRRTYQPQQKQQLLKHVATLQNYAHQPLPVVSLFLKKYLFLHESGGLFLDLVLKLMHWLHFSSHTELLQDYLSPLYTLFISSAVRKKCGIIRTLAQLFSNLMATRTYKHQHDLFLHVNPEWNAETTYICILKYVSYMFGQALSQAESTAILLPEVLRFYEKVLTAIEETGTKLYVLPPLGLLVAALTSYDASTLSRVCQLLIRCNSTIRRHPQRMNRYYKEVSQALTQYNTEMQHTLKGHAFPADNGIFCKWIKDRKLKSVLAKRTIVEVRLHPAVNSVMWPILNQKTHEPHARSREMVELSALRSQLPHIYNYVTMR